MELQSTGAKSFTFTLERTRLPSIVKKPSRSPAYKRAEAGVSCHTAGLDSPMGTQQICLLMQLLGFFLASTRGHVFFSEEQYEDDFVDVDFKECPQCEHNYRNFVFILKNSDEAAASIYPYVACIMWLILAALVICQRWMQIKQKL